MLNATERSSKKRLENCPLEQFSTGGDFASQGCLAVSGDISGCHNMGEVLLVSSG